MHATVPQGTADLRPRRRGRRIRSERDARPGLVAACALCVALVGAACWTPAADAQLRAGANGAYRSGAYDWNFGLGARAEASLDVFARGLTLVGTYDHFFPDCTDCSSYDAGLQLLLAPPTGLYMGLGANLGRFDGGESNAGADSDWTMNLIAGIRLPLLPVVLPFFEFRQQLLSSGINQQTVVLGVIFSPAAARNVPRRPRSR